MLVRLSKQKYFFIISVLKENNQRPSLKASGILMKVMNRCHVMQCKLLALHARNKGDRSLYTCSMFVVKASGVTTARAVQVTSQTPHYCFIQDFIHLCISLYRLHE